jgi:virginiamycin B lyase
MTRPRIQFWILWLLLAGASSPSRAAMISGTVKDTDGAPLKGVFVQARDTKTGIMTMVVSGADGHYRLPQLAVGEYQVTTKTTGYGSDAVVAVKLSADQASSVDLSLQKRPVQWNELSIHQARVLWPASPAKDKLFAVCFTCHGFQTRMASAPHEHDVWRGLVLFMQVAMKFGLEDRINDQEADEVASYLTSLYGASSVLPKYADEAPRYQETLRPLDDRALNITYTEFSMPAPSRMPFSAAPDNEGYFWIPNFGVANRITRLDPRTGEMHDYPVPNVGTAAVHSAVPAADGTVWLTEQGSNKIGKWDPHTRKIVEFQDAYLPGKLAYGAGSKHTLRFDPAGNVWSSGNPLTKFDRKTQQFVRFEEIKSTYDVKEDQNGNIWFTRPDTHQIGMVDWKTLKVSQWSPPTPRSFPRRMQIDDAGIVWFGEYNAGKLGRFDPRTETFTEYPLPGPEPTPYGLGIDAENHIWYSSYAMDVVGRFNPKTGETVEYPFPHSENTIRELIPDAQGRMWYGSPSNDKVGYFTLRADGGRTGNRGRAMMEPGPTAPTVQN